MVSMYATQLPHQHGTVGPYKGVGVQVDQDGFKVEVTPLRNFGTGSPKWFWALNRARRAPDWHSKGLYALCAGVNAHTGA